VCHVSGVHSLLRKTEMPLCTEVSAEREASILHTHAMMSCASPNAIERQSVMLAITEIQPTTKLASTEALRGARYAARAMSVSHGQRLAMRHQYAPVQT